MAVKTNAEIQADYRAKAKETGEKRLNTFIKNEAYLALENLVKTCGLTKKELIEFLLLEELEKARIKRIK